MSPGPVPGVCPTDKLWLACAQGPASCAELSAPRETNWTCRPGCHCPPGTLLMVSGLPAGLLRAGTLDGREGTGRAWVDAQTGDPAELRGDHRTQGRWLSSASRRPGRAAFASPGACFSGMMVPGLCDSCLLEHPASRVIDSYLLSTYCVFRLGLRCEARAGSALSPSPGNADPGPLEWRQNPAARSK